MFATEVICQQETTNWFFGQNAGLTFTSNPPAITTGSLVSWEACTAVSDNSGNLLFYTDGITVYSSSHTVMANGNALFGNTSSSQALIVKQPGTSGNYFIFYTANLGGALYYSTVNMSLAGGSGSVTAKNLLLASNASEKIAGVRHCNGVDVWVLTHDTLSSFRAHLVTAAGVGTTAVVSNIGSVHGGGSGAIGQMKISPQGRKVGLYSVFDFELFDFNNSNGAVTNSLVLLSNTFGYGCEFSSDGTKFYGTSAISVLPPLQYVVRQWDLCAGSPTAVVSSMQTFSTGFSVAAMQLAKNGKIYITNLQNPSLSVINNPNLPGAASGVSFAAQSCSPGVARYGLPGFLSSAFVPTISPFTYSVHSMGGCNAATFTAPASVLAASLCPAAIPQPTLQWNFGDTSSGQANTSTLNIPTHVFTTPGTYSVQLILTGLCGNDTLRQLVTVNQTCMSFSSTGISCSAPGTATVFMQNTAGPFAYTWLPTNQTSSVISGVFPGTYTVFVTDLASSFTYSQSVTFTTSTAITASVSSSFSAPCSGGAATATVTLVNGGTGQHAIAWNNTVFIYGGQVATSLTAGSWTVTITDSLSGCLTQSVFSIYEPPLLSLSIAATPSVACLGDTIRLQGNGSGGTAPYSFSWTGGPASHSMIVSEPAWGTYVYSLTLTDSNTCSVTSTVVGVFVSNPTVVLSSASICPQQVAVLTASGATSYSWSGGGSGNTKAVSPSTTSMYTVVGSAAGCTAVAYGMVVVLAPPLIQAGNNSPLCEGKTLSLFILGASQYTWNGPGSFQSFASNPVLPNTGPVNAGAYTVTASALNGCTATAITHVTVSATPTVAAFGSTVCSSGTLQLSATASAGASYTWTGPGNANSFSQIFYWTNPPFSAAGYYTVTIIDQAGCSNTAAAHGSVVADPSLNVTLSSPSLCAQAFNGSPNTITLTADSDNTYTLITSAPVISSTNGNTVAITTDQPYLPAGLSTATLFASNSVCTISLATSFSIIANPTVSVASQTPFICAGKEHTYTCSGASGYVWSSTTPNYTTYSNGGVAVANPSINSVFSVYGTSLGCNSALVTRTLTVYPIPTLQLTPDRIFICPGSAATLQTSGTASSFNWFPFGTPAGPGGNALVVSPDSPTTYTVIGATNGCTNAATASVYLFDPPAPAIASTKTLFCVGEKAKLIASGGIKYEWFGPQQTRQEANPFVAELLHEQMAGSYTVMATDTNGCTGIAVTELSLHPVPKAKVTGATEGCEPFTGTFRINKLNGDITGAHWKITKEVKVIGDFKGETLHLSGIPTGNYQVSARFIDTATGCSSAQNLGLHVFEKPAADFTWTPTHPLAGMEEVELNNLSSGKAQTDWSWYLEPAPGLFSRDQTAHYMFMEEGRFPIVLVVSNQWNCSDTAIRVLETGTDFVLFVPNAFTPNSDSRNEHFFPIVRGIKKYQMQIFDRWGERLFVTEDPATGWDGTFLSSPCKQDNYVWKISLTTISGELKQEIGHVMLLRSD